MDISLLNNLLYFFVILVLVLPIVATLNKTVFLTYPIMLIEIITYKNSNVEIIFNNFYF